MTPNAATAVTTLSTTSPFAPCNVPAPFFLTPQELVDFPGILSSLQTTAYLNLLRLSWGWHSETCTIGLDGLATRINACRNTARKAVRELADIGLIEPGQTTDFGTTYRVRLPREISPWKELIAQKEEKKDKRQKTKDKVVPSRQPTVETTYQPEPKVQIVLPVPLDTVQTLNLPGSNFASNKEMELIREDQNNTTAPVSVVPGPVLQLRDITDGSGFVSPLEGLTEGSLGLAYRLAGPWTVLRALITLLVSYLSSSVLNPVGLLKWALKSKDFVPLSDKDIVSDFAKKINYFFGHVPINEKHYFSNEFNELTYFLKWLELNFEYITLEILWSEYHRQCKETAKKYRFIWFFMITDPAKEKRRK